MAQDPNVYWDGKDTVGDPTTWSNAANWVTFEGAPYGAIPGATNFATFDSLSLPNLLTLGGNQSVGALLFKDNADDYTIGDGAGSDILSLTAASGIGIKLDATPGGGDAIVNFDLEVAATQIWLIQAERTLTTAGSLTLKANLTLTDDVVDNQLGGSFIIGSAGKELINSGGNRTLIVDDVLSDPLGVDLTINSNIKLSESATTGRTFTLNLAQEGVNAVINGDIIQGSSGNGNFTKSGPGNLDVNGNLNYGGTTNLSGGGEVNVNGNVTTGSWNVNNGTELTINGSFSTSAFSVNNNSLVLFNTDSINTTGWTISSGTVNVNSTSGTQINIDSLVMGGTTTPGTVDINFNPGVILNLGGDITARYSSTSEFLLDADTINLNGQRVFTVDRKDTTLTIESDLTNGTASSRVHKAGLGTVILKGTNTTSGANNALTKGTLVLDFREKNTAKLSSEAMTIYNGDLVLIGNESAASSQTIGDLSIIQNNTTYAQGVNNIILQPQNGQVLTLNLGNITRTSGAGGTLHFEIPANGTINTTTSDTALLGGWATFNNGTEDYFAAIVEGQVVAATSTINADITRSWSPTLLNRNVGDGESGFSGVSDYMNVDSIRFSGDSALSVLESLNIASGGILVTESSASTGILGGVLTVEGSNDLVVTHHGSSLFEISSSIRRASDQHGGISITKNGDGTLVLNGSNITGSATSTTSSSGTLRINEGTVIVAGGSAISDNTDVAQDGTVATSFILQGNEAIANLTGTNTLATTNIGSHTLTLNSTGTTQTYSSQLVGDGNIIKNNLNPAGTIGTWVINSSSNANFTGNLQVNAGAVSLAGSGVNNLGAINSITINQRGALIIDNNGAAAGAGPDYEASSRINDAARVILNGANGRETSTGALLGLNMRTNTNSTHGELIANLDIKSGANYFLAESSTTASNTSSVSLLRVTDAITRESGATLSVRGFNLGGASGSRTRLQMTGSTGTTASVGFANQFRGAGVYGNGNTALATTSNANNPTAGDKGISIVPWAIGQNLAAAANATTNGNSFVTFQSDLVGFRTLNLTTEYATYTDASSGNGNNVRESLTSNLTGLTGSTVNSLLINNQTNSTTAVTFSGSGVLGVTSGAFLFTGVGAANANGIATQSANQGGIIVEGFSGIEVTGNNKEYIMFVTNTSIEGVTIRSNLTTQDANFTKSGLGKLKLTGDNSAVADVTVNEGVLEISNLNSVGGSTGKIALNGGTLRLSNITGDVYNAAANSLSTRLISVGEGTIGTLDTNGISITAGAFADGAGTFVKTGVGTLTLTGTAASQHTGLFVVESQGTTAQTVAQLILNNANGNAISGNLQVGNLDYASQAGSAVVHLGRSDQIVDSAVINITGRSGNNSFFKLMGFNETVAGITDTSGGGVIQVAQNENLGAGVQSTLTLAGDGNYYYNGYLRNNSGSANAGTLNITKSGTGTQTFSGTQVTYTGTTRVQAGKLILRDTTNFNGSIVNDAELEMERAAGTAWSYSGTISGAGNVRKTGASTSAVTFNAASTYTGTTDIDSGTLSLGVNGSINPSRAINIKHQAIFDVTAKVAGYTYGGIISGGGTVSGSLNLTSGGSLRAGASSDPYVNATTGDQLGSLRFTQNLTMSSGSSAILQIMSASYNDVGAIAAYGNGTLATYLSDPGKATELNSYTYLNSASGIANHDYVDVDGTFTWEGGSTITYELAAGGSLTAGDVLNMWDWTSISGSYDLGLQLDSMQRTGGTLGDLVLPDIDGLIYDLTLFESHGIIVVVPEPSKCLLLCAGFAALLIRRRRSQSAKVAG